MGGYMGHAGSMAVKEIRVTDRDVWTLTDGGVGGRKRGGAVKWSVGYVRPVAMDLTTVILREVLLAWLQILPIPTRWSPAVRA
jgi:hypothetical protein